MYTSQGNQCTVNLRAQFTCRSQSLRVKSCSSRKTLTHIVQVWCKIKTSSLKVDERSTLGHGVTLGPLMTHFGMSLIDVAVAAKPVACQKNVGEARQALTEAWKDTRTSYASWIIFHSQRPRLRQLLKSLKGKNANRHSQHQAPTQPAQVTCSASTTSPCTARCVCVGDATKCE